MRITDVRIRKVNDEGKMKAVVSVTFDDEFVVHDIKVIEGQNGLFIAMPSRKMGEGDFRDIAHPLTSETRNRIKAAIFEEYEKVLEEKAEEAAVKQAALQEEAVFEEENAEKEEVFEKAAIL
ncbi:MAG: septation regulator SpoVG [Eubacteriales bacterium]|nr:septation regulator SpoVG [Eubacteriales bacterium]MDD4582918.1 septation regulator SpoVG [Eubacteriales bacterium]